ATGDKVALGPVELALSVTPGAVPLASPPEVAKGEDPSLALQARAQELEAKRRQLEDERAAWEHRCRELDAERRHRNEAVEAAARKLGEREGAIETREKLLNQAREEILRLRQQLEAQGVVAGKQHEEANALSSEVAKMRQQLYQKYHERRE